MAVDTATISVQRFAKTLLTFTTLHFLFFLASLVAIPILAPGSKIPNPFGNDADVKSFLLRASSAIRVSDFLQLASALCLAAASALLAKILPDQGDREASRWLILSGGSGAAILLALSALFSWAMVAPRAPDPGPALHTLQFLPFLFGGPGWAGFFAIFLVGIAAGTREALPRWLRRTGYFLGFVSAAATAVLLSIIFSPCLPIARFLGFLWLIAISVCLKPSTRISIERREE